MEISRLREAFEYDANTGDIVWKIATPSTGVAVGDVAGTMRLNGYLQVCFKRKTYLNHRLAWALLYGEWPNGEIDHINGNRADNRPANLRVVDRRTNAENKRKPAITNSTGALGVQKKNGRFCAGINSRGKYRWLGIFDTIEDAAAAYVEAKRQLHQGCTL